MDLHKRNINIKDQNSSKDRDDKKGPSTGGYGDQHDRERRERDKENVDNGSNRTYPEMQSGYGDKQNDIKDEYGEGDKPYGEGSYENDKRGEDRPYKGNKYGSPDKEERYEPSNSLDQDQENDSGSKQYSRERKLRREPLEREKGDRNREW